MICFETEYLNIGRVLLLAVGMWPYKQSKLISLQVILCYTLLLSIMIVQFTPFLTAECSPDLVIKILSMVLFCSTYTIIYNSFQINKHIIRSLMDHLQRIFNTIKDDYEIAILRKYGYNARCYEFACAGTFVVLAAGTFLIACAKCNCGMFTIASYRVEHAMDIYIPQRIDLKNEFMITNKIIQAVDIHRKSMKLIRDFISTFERTLFCIIIISVVCLSLNFYRIFQVVSFDGNVEEFIVHSTVVSIIFIYIFIINYFAQEILDHNNEIFIAVYNTRWYTAPLCIQKMILFLLQRGTRGFNLKIGGLFLACLESSATLISTSMSYFTVLCSM
ncbi:uncharacterized protein LOC109504529 isoform X2 [Harpegnathos saltator]|uniref:uncharacterized protein LOC109504529 isoform X2 n=1 Tax=Harpegnathos saltator TaxID=610380 RepID=UPI000948E1D7|nr:uncharacterized protein LOC109504529 isoform X2 [Harpegnathos saltator]